MTTNQLALNNLGWAQKSTYAGIDLPVKTNIASGLSEPPWVTAVIPTASATCALRNVLQAAIAEHLRRVVGLLDGYGE